MGSKFFIFFIAARERRARFAHRVCCMHTRFAHDGTSNLANCNLYAYWGLVHNPRILVLGKRDPPARLLIRRVYFKHVVRERQGDRAITINTQDRNYD